MKTIEILGLLEKKEKVIDIPVEVVQAFRNWKKRRNDDVLSNEEIFYAGYVMANPVVREKYKKAEKLGL